MHPDQTTPDSHRHTASDSHRHQADHDTARVPEQDQDSPAIEPERDAAPAAAEMPDGEARVAEAGNAYVGRTMDDELKANPRVTDADEAIDETPTDASEG